MSETVNGNVREAPGAQAEQAPPAQEEQRSSGNGGQAREQTGEDPRIVAARAEAAKLQQELEAARRRVDELARAFQAMNQEREEFKQRLVRERERMIDVEKGGVALTLLEAIDELDRCLSASATDDSPLAQGVRLIRDNVLAKVQAMGIERLNLMGKPFDPNVADAVDMEVTTQPDEDQKVVAEIHAGYKLKDRVIRPARVKVAKYVQPAQA
jgi:molecular chaperone GrpE